MLVASLLLGMLVTILTMVFNASSIAWRTGKAGVSQLSSIRRQLSFAQYNADNLLPCVNAKNDGEVGCVIGAWKSDGTIRTRAAARLSGDIGFTAPSFSDFNSAKSSLDKPAWMQFQCSASLKLGSAQSYVVGVLSYGPDGERDTEDDITTWPLEVN
jgi:hypothetical protein